MKIRSVILLFCLGTGPFYAQSLFDDEGLDTAEPKPAAKPATKKAVVEDDTGEEAEQPVVKVRKKRKARKKKKAPKENAAIGSDYSPEAIARQSYAWAPETETVSLSSTAPGMGQREQAKVKPAVASEANTGVRPAQQGFKLPQIPLAQVLIVAGFVILFLIYRFRIGRQIKRKRY